MFELSIIIIIGSLAWSGASNGADLTNSYDLSLQRIIFVFFPFIAFPISLTNGLLMHGTRGALIAGIGTILGKVFITNIFYSGGKVIASEDYINDEDKDDFHEKMGLKRKIDDRKIQFGIFFCLLNLLLTIKIIFS